MRRAAALALLSLAACQPAVAPTFDVAGVKPSEEPASLTGWYQAAEAARQFRLYPSSGDLTAMGKGQCVSGVASSLAGIPPETLNGRKVTITGPLYAAGSPDIGDTPNACGAGAVMIANDIVYADEK
jgi:hypothetical protein